MNNFPEAKLEPGFAQDKIKNFKQFIDSTISFTVVSMPGVGVSYFLKYLSCQNFAHFIHIDLYSLPTLSQHEFYRMFLTNLGGKPSSKTDEQVFLETKAIIKKMAEKHDKVVIIFSRFDQLKKALDENFLSNLQSLTTLALSKIVLIFTAIKPLYEMVPEAVKGGNLPFYSKVLYFTPFLKEDLKKLFLLDHTAKAHPDLDELIEKSGGHNQLLHMFVNSHKKQNLLLDKFVNLQLKDLVHYLDYSQRKQVQNIALGRKIPEVDEYLLGVGFAKETKSGYQQAVPSGYQIFSPILEDYIKANLPVKLPVKEKALFNLLRKNLGTVVSKDEIFSTVWENDSNGATDWALDALVYRLRKHPFLHSHGYIIESQKKVGYILIQV